MYRYDIYATLIVYRYYDVNNSAGNTLCHPTTPIVTLISPWSLVYVSFLKCYENLSHGKIPLTHVHFGLWLQNEFVSGNQLPDQFERYRPRHAEGDDVGLFRLAGHYLSI